MLIELGNHSAVPNAIDERPKITRIHIPEADKKGLGGYTHKPGGITPADFKAHLADAAFIAGAGQLPITRLPDHEALQSVVAAWRAEGASGKPAWVQVTAHDLTPKGHAADIEAFLGELYECPRASEYFSAKDQEELLVKKELTHWTNTPPGLLGSGLALPAATALYTDAGRVISNINDGGGQVGYTAAATASSSTTLTNSGASWTSNQWAGYRVYAQSSTSNMVWGNVLSNTATALTVDRWYAAATPGGAAGSTPSSTSPFLIADGGAVSSWFVGLTSTNITPAHGDTSMSGEITTASSGLLRKIAPYAQTSGVASRSLTLTPVYTATSSDTFPTTVYAIGVFVSMIVASTPLCMKFETSLNASATFNAIGDQATVTETIQGS